MTAAFQASIKYPLIWIINTANPSESEPRINKAHKKIKKMVRFIDWLRAHYETAYHYYLTQHLHEYGIGTGEIQDFLGLRVTGAKTLHISLYRKSWSEVYVDVIIRAYVDIFTGDESSPQCGHSYTDYRVRGYYDLYEKRCQLFQYFMPYRSEDDMDKPRLDEYLVPIINKNDLEDTAHWFLEEHYPDAFLNPGRINIKAMIREMGLHAYRTGLSEDEKINGVLYLKGKRVTLYTDDGTPFSADVPDKTILIERKLCRDNPKKANHTALHECTHYGLHSLFFLFQAAYIEELHQYFDPIDEEKLPLDDEGRKEISLMEWQAKRLTPRIQMPEEWIDEKMQELLQKYAWMNEYVMYEQIIRELSEYFHVSKEMVKYRLEELGYSNTRGILNYINEAYIPAYKVPSEISPYQTFDISFDELLYLRKTNSHLCDVLSTGEFLYCEGHICLNREEYIQIGKDSRPHLTDYARSHMIECCILFIRHRFLRYDYQTGVLHDSEPIINYAEIGAHFDFIGNIIDPLERAKKRNAINRYIPNFFSDLLVFHMARLRIMEEDLEEFSGVSVSTITRYRTQNDYNRTEPKLLALSVGLSLEPDFSRDFLKKGGYSFNKETVVVDMIDIMLDTMYKEPVEVWRNYFVSHGYAGLI